MTLPTRPAALPLSFAPMTASGGIRAAMTRAPDKVAITFGDETRTFADLVRRIDQAARATVLDLGLGKGDVAAIISRNRIEYFEIVCGVPDAGVPVATVNARLSANEAVAIFEDCGATVVFAEPAWAKTLRGMDLKTVRRIIEIGPEYEAWLLKGDAEAVLPLVEEWDTWTIPYTSGTTGKPKGVMIPHRSRMLNYLAMAVEYACYGPDDKFLGITPMNHGAGLSFVMAPIVFGGSVEIMDKFDPEAVLRKLKFDGFTGIFTVPTHFHGFFALPPEVLERYSRPPLKAIMSNAAPLSQAMKERIVPYFGEGLLHELYGSTEAAIVSSLRPAKQLVKQRCVGLPFPMTEVRLVAAGGGECGPGEVGELFSRSPYMFNGYWNRDAETAAAFDGDWVSVGDLAMRDEEGYLHIVDRKKDMVISGGVNIYPREIEEFLLTHPGVADIAVVGIPDEQWGEILRAFVVAKPGQTVDAADLIGFCTGQMTAYKIPKDIRFIDALPRNDNGKVLKAELRKA